MNIREYLKSNRLITDGAMGTYYEKKYPSGELLPEKENLLHPERIREIHLEYLQAGARLLRTNTFAIAPLFYSDEQEMMDGICAGVMLAKDAVDTFRMQTGCTDEIFIGADFGPILLPEEEGEEEALQLYHRICDRFLACGLDVFVFESQQEYKYVESLAQYVKERTGQQAFVIAQFTFDKSGYTRAGLSMRKINRMMADSVVDAYGYNCGMEAGHLYQLMAEGEIYSDKYLTALPNAGYPLSIRGKTIYTENERYFVEKSKLIAGLGADIMGGCCGTTPGYITDLVKALADVPREEKKISSLPDENKRSLEDHTSQVHGAGFLQKLRDGKQPIIVEMDPPFAADVSKVMDGARLLKEAGVDLMTLSDSPMARARMDAGAVAGKIIREVGIPVMPHLTCRDRNIIALRGTIMGEYLNDIRNLLIVTGDPVARDARGNITGVFDSNSIRLMEYVKNMNEELYSEEPIHYGGALNYHGANPDAIIRRMIKKMENGCEFFLTQPIYSKEDIDRIRYIKSKCEAKIMCGIMPLVSYRNAMFIHNEMAGIHIPEDILAKYREDMTKEEAEKVAIDISLSLVERLKDVADGYYFMTPFNRAGLICDIIREMK